MSVPHTLPSLHLCAAATTLALSIPYGKNTPESLLPEGGALAEELDSAPAAGTPVVVVEVTVALLLW